MPQIANPQEFFAFKLGMALKTEQTVLQILKQSEQQAQDPELKQQFSHHREETEQQIQNLEQAFDALGESSTAHQSPTADALRQEAEQLLEKVSPELSDAVLLGGAAHVEHHEISMYEGLITMAEAMDEQDVVGLLQENLEQEQHTLDEVKKATEKLAKQVAQAA